MLEAVDTERDRFVRCDRRAVVSSDLDAIAMRHVDDGAHFIRHERGRTDAAVRIGDATGDRDLDPGCTLLDLLAYDLRHLRGTVGLEIAVPAGCSDDLAGRVNTWTEGRATVDRAFEREVAAMVLAGQANRRDTCIERLARVVRHAHDQLHVVLVDERGARRTGQLQPEVHVHVEETGRKPLPVERQLARVGGQLHRARRTDRLDAIALDEHDGVLDDRSVLDVDDGRARNRDRRSLGRASLRKYCSRNSWRESGQEQHRGGGQPRAYAPEQVVHIFSPVIQLRSVRVHRLAGFC